MVTEERDKTNCKHDCNKEQKKYVEATNPFKGTLKQKKKKQKKTHTYHT
jgi:hypothetical protein